MQALKAAKKKAEAELNLQTENSRQQDIEKFIDAQSYLAEKREIISSLKRSNSSSEFPDIKMVKTIQDDSSKSSSSSNSNSSSFWVAHQTPEAKETINQRLENKETDFIPMCTASNNNHRIRFFLFLYIILWEKC